VDLSTSIISKHTRAVGAGSIYALSKNKTTKNEGGIKKSFDSMEDKNILSC
jgi:hypothetical protein